MKKSDLLFILVLACIFGLIYWQMDAYMNLVANHPYIMGFIQYALLSTIGEMFGLRLRTGSYTEKGFGALPRAFVWGVLGLTIVAAIQIFGAGTPAFIAGLFDVGGTEGVGAIMGGPLSGMKVLFAFIMAFFMDVFFSPLFMIVHNIFAKHIEQTGGTLKGFFTHKVKYSENLQNADWSTQWKFVFMKTIPLFWIPAHTIMYLLPSEFQVLFSSMLGIVLGFILFIANRKK